MATRMFFRASTGNTAGYVATEKSTVLPAGTANLGGNPARDLSTTAGTSAVLGNFATLSQTAHQDGFFRKFISAPLTVSDITAQTWTLGVSVGQSNNHANAFIVCSVYVLTSGDTVRGFVYDSDTPLGNEWPLGSNAGRVVTFSGAAVSGVVSTDRLCVEFWYHSVQGMAASYTLDFGYDGTTAIVEGTANADPASFIETPQDGLFVADVLLAGTAAGSSTADGVLTGEVPLVGAAAGSSTGVGVLTVPVDVGYLDTPSPGVTGDQVEGTTQAFYSTGNLEVIVCIRYPDWVAGGGSQVRHIAGSGSSTVAWTFEGQNNVAGDATSLRLRWWDSGGVERTLTATPGALGDPGANNHRWLRVVWNPNNGGAATADFYYSEDPIGTDPASVSWTLINQANLGATSDIRTGAGRRAQIGGNAGTGALPRAGEWFVVYTYYNGTRVWSPDFRDNDQGWSTEPGTDDDGGTWDIQGSAAWVAPSGGTVGLTGAAAGSSTGQGVLTATVSLTGTTDGTSTGQGVLTGDVPLAGQAAGTSTGTGVLSGDVPLAGTADGASTADGVLSGEVPLTGAAAGASTADGVLSGDVPLAGTADGTSTATGTLTGDIALAATAAGGSTADSDLTIQGSVALTGSAAGGSTASSVLNVDIGLVGTGDGSSTATAVLSGDVPLAATADGTSTGTGDLTVTGATVVLLTGTAAGTSTGTGSLVLVLVLAGTSNGISTGVGDLTVDSPVIVLLIGTSTGGSTATGQLAVSIGLTGAAAGVSTAVGLLSVVGLTFWTPNGVAYTPAGVAYTPVDPDQPPPW